MFGDSKNDKEQSPPQQPFDVYLLFVTLLLVFIGMIMVFSSSAVFAKAHFNDSYYFLKKEILYVCLGLVLLFVAKRISYRNFWQWTYPFLLITFILMVTALVMGTFNEMAGVKRWIRVGSMTFQPSELAKLSVVIFVAYALAKKREKVREFTKGYLPILALSGLYILMTLAQKDLGSALTLGFIVGAMLFISGTKMAYLAGTAITSLPVLYYLIFSIDFRRRRILAFLDPWQYQLDYGFQIIQSFVAFKSGGLTGTGLGQGKQKLFYLPEAHTDFIFSVIGEELGLIGVLSVVGLFIIFIFRGFLITLRTKDLFGLYLAFGITSLIGAEAFINIGVVMGLLPTKGLALPFISYGGSSLVVSMLAVGILLNISMNTEEEF